MCYLQVHMFVSVYSTNSEFYDSRKLLARMIFCSSQRFMAQNNAASFRRIWDNQRKGHYRGVQNDYDTIPILAISGRFVTVTVMTQKGFMECRKPQTVDVNLAE